MLNYTINAIDTVEMKNLRAVNKFYKDGYLSEYQVPTFAFPNGVQIVSIDVLNYLLALMRGERDEAIEEVKELKSNELKIKNLTSKLDSLKEENQQLKKNLKEYDLTYGKYISPFTIIEELYRGINLPYMILKERIKFKIKVGPKQYNYWIGVFIDLKIVRRIDKSKVQSIVSYDDAMEILYTNDYVWKGK